jgi:LmbE family N-acetylglucosaminyl deacetylase
MMLGAEDWARTAIELLGAPREPILLLGTARALAPALTAAGSTVVAVDDPDEFEFAEGSAGGAIVLAKLETTQWDRWLLQRVHRALVPGARLVLSAENAAVLESFGDVAYWIAGAIKTLRIRLTGRPGKFRARRYRSGPLRRMLEALGFEVESFDAIGARGFRIVARRLPSLMGIDAARPFPDARDVRRRYEGGTLIATRDAWAREFAAWVSPPREFDPGTFAGAGVLVLAPHPDDELIGCGGTSLRLMAAGAAVHVVQATDGSDAASLWHASDALRRTVRLEEAERVARAAGYASIECWREPNDAFRASETNVLRLAATLADLRPRLVFVPFVSDIHEDHRRLAAILAQALERTPLGPDAEVLGYEVWSHVPANAWCDVSAEMPRLERLLWLYETAMKVDDYVHFCAERNHYNALAVAGRSGFVEAFHIVPAARFPELVRSVGTST